MRTRRSVLALAAAALSVAAARPAVADEGEARPPAIAIGLIRDLRVKSLAERALAADRVLAPLNLSVKVRHGVAEVSGSIPSDEVGRQALAKVETVKGVEEVRANFRYTGDARQAMAPPARTRDKRAVVQTAKPIAPPGESETPRARPGGQVPLVSGGEGHKTRPEKPAGPTPKEAGPKEEPRSAVRVGAPRTVTPKVAKRQAAAEEKPLPLAERVERVRQSQIRFRSIPVEVEGDLLVVKRGSAPSEDATALSQALRRIPGVSGVLIARD
jgi:hypothetical protein